jgi:hypothetical protein
MSLFAGPIERAVVARIRERIKGAEEIFKVKVANLDDGLKADLKALRAKHRLAKASALQTIVDANAIALEWITEARLQHVLDKLPEAKSITDTAAVIAAMWADVAREAGGEIVESKMAQAKCNARSAQLWKQHLAKGLEKATDSENG